MDRLEDQVVCVTGAGRGLGRALAEAFDVRGARLALAARTAPEIEALAARCRDAIAVPTDVRDFGDMERLIDAVVGQFGRLDVMINNAGLAIYGPVEGLTDREIDLMVDTNVKGVIYGSQLAFKVMKAQRSGTIVNISSIAGKLHLPNEAVYNATKWAVNGFTGTLRMEATPYNVRVSCVCPGGIDTPFWKVQEFHPFPDHIHPERDFMRPEDVAQSVLHVVDAPPGYVVPEVVMLPMI